MSQPISVQDTKVTVKMIYGTFQCKIRHSLAQTMAVCVFCQKSAVCSENN